ncbi:YozE family protein [Virgibacillus ainsalahensis]
MKFFYQFLMSYRGNKNPDDYSRLADWAFFDHSFPKHSKDYDEISRYLEWNTPFANALMVFDDLWDIYKEKEN